MEITAAVLRDGGAPYSLERIELAGPGEREVLVRIAAVGMCHSDALLRSSTFPATLPIIGGHEGAGIVEAVGAGVEGIVAGDHVVLTFDSCGNCRNCVDGHPAVCATSAHRNLLGWRVDGSAAAVAADGSPVGSRWFAQSSFATHAIATSRNAVVVDEALPLHVLAPLGCGIQTGAGAVLNSLDVQAGSSLVVFGAGAVGLAAVLGGVVAGASTIVVVDLHHGRRDLAVEFGATHVFDGSQVDVARQVRKLTRGGADYAIDATGVPRVAESALAATRVGGACALLGVLTGPLTLKSDALTGKTLVGVVEGDATPQEFIPRLISLWSAGQLPIERLIEQFPLEAINEAEQASLSGRVVKPVLIP